MTAEETNMALASLVDRMKSYNIILIHLGREKKSVGIQLGEAEPWKIIRN